MHNVHSKNTVRYYLFTAFLLLFFFFSNDFALTDVQKTAIVIAAGIDREEDTFIVTSQIAIPQSSKQGKASEAVQLVSRGKTVADAFEEINAKTGWYPKLVFCDFILLGEGTVKENVFDALEFFLRDEYLTDNCLVATCNGHAKDLLNTSALVDPSSSLAMKKVLSSHAERVGTVLPATLKDFSIGYFSDSKSAFLPILKKEPQQETISGGQADQNGSDSSSNSSSQGSGQENDQNSQGSQGGQSNQSSQSGAQQDKPVFSAKETALFVGGKRVGTLTEEETFAVATVLNPLRLASYSVEREGKTCSLTIKQNNPSTKLKVGNENNLTLNVNVTLTAGILDYSKAQSIENISDSGDVPKEYFFLAEKKLKGDITRAFEKCRAVQCDVFGVRERLIKYEKKHLKKFADTALRDVRLNTEITFRNIR